MRDRIYINESYRDTVLKDVEQKNILGFNLGKKIDVFFVAVALGLDNPIEFQGKKDGYFQLHNNVGTFEKSLFGSILLGKITNVNEIDNYANEYASYDEAEKCAESGFIKLKEKIESANGNEELLEKRLMAEITLLYEKNVKSNI